MNINMFELNCDKFEKFEDIDNKIATSLNTLIFGNNPRYANKNIFNNKAINLSGSTVINLYNNLINNSTDIILNNDLDIYIDLSAILQNDINTILMDLFKSGYMVLDTNGYFDDLDDGNNIRTFNYHQYKELILNQLDDLYSKERNIYNIENIESNNEYENLSKYIYHVEKYINAYTNKKIDIIFIKCDIKLLLLESFDYDIVKNYYNQGYLYIYNKDAIKNKIATITLEHFNVCRIIDSKTFNKFIQRYKKYHQRGYTIFIDSYEIKINFINKLLIVFKILFNIDIDNYSQYKKNNIIDFQYKKNNIIDFIKVYFINKLLIEEELIKITCHPSKIQKILEFGNDIEDIW